MEFSELNAGHIEKAANMMKAIAHPIRLAIVGQLTQVLELTVTEIQEVLKIEQSTASHHLRILKDRGILISRREGQNIVYTVKNKNLNNLMNCISECSCVDD